MLPPLAGFDIDGVLADPAHRLHFLAGQKKNWPFFFAGAGQDAPLSEGLEMVEEAVENGQALVYVSGRPERIWKDPLK